MLLAPTFTESCQRQVEATQAALERAVERLEALARTVLPARQAEELLETCGLYRSSAARLQRPLRGALELVDCGDVRPVERAAVEREARALLRELEELAAEAAGLTAELARRVHAGA
jgi:hypothetical protein